MSTVRLVCEWPVEGGPDGIAVSRHGEVFVNINNNHRIAKYSAEGLLRAEWSFEGQARGIAVSPHGEVFVNINNTHRVVKYGAGEVFVNINNTHRIVKYSGEGELLAQWPAEGEASGIAVSGDGEVFVNINNTHRNMRVLGNGEISVNINNNYRVVKYDPEGHVLAEWPAQGAAGGLAISPEGAVSSVQNLNRVVSSSPVGGPLGEWTVVAGVIETNGIVIGHHGEVFVAIKNSHRIAKHSPEGELLAEWGGEGDQPGEFRSPAGLALGPDGLVYVADKGNCRVQVFRCP